VTWEEKWNLEKNTPKGDRGKGLARQITNLSHNRKVFRKKRIHPELKKHLREGGHSEKTWEKSRISVNILSKGEAQPGEKDRGTGSFRRKSKGSYKKKSHTIILPPSPPERNQ